MPHRFLQALSSRNYRLYFTGQAVSLMGSWMTTTASLWLIYHLTSSKTLLGVVGFASQAPMFILAPFAGVWIDRINRHRLLILTQVLSMLQSFALAAFVFTHKMDAGILISLSFVQGIINAFDMPTRQAMVIEFIERKEHLGNAIALNSSMFNLARLVGPAVAGYVINWAGAGGCYVVDGISYVAVIISLLMMRLKENTPHHKQPHPVQALQEGFRTAFGFAPIRALIIVVGLVSFLGFGYMVLLPVFARDVFHGDARSLGHLMAGSGVGALLGATYLGTRSTVRGLGTVIAVGGTLMGVGIIGFSQAPSEVVGMFCLVFVGGGGVLLMASSNTLVQSLIEDHHRGRVMSIFTMAFTGTMPLGNLVIGKLAEGIGVHKTLLISGASCLLVVFFFFRELPRLRKLAHPVLARLDPNAAEPMVYSEEEGD